MRKTVSFGPNPRKEKPDKINPDDWVKNQSGKDELKRFTIDIPKALHTRIKTFCASRGVKMREEVMQALEKYFALND